MPHDIGADLFEEFIEGIHPALRLKQIDARSQSNCLKKFALLRFGRVGWCMPRAIISTKNKEQSFIFRPGLLEYTVLAVFNLVVGCAVLQTPSYFGFVILFLIVGFTGILLFGFTFKVTPLVVSKRTLMEVQTIPFAALAKVEIVTGGRPPIALVFTPTKESGLEPIVVNMKPYRRQDLRALARFLLQIAPQAQFDKGITRMADGKMPSLFASNDAG